MEIMYEKSGEVNAVPLIWIYFHRHDYSAQYAANFVWHAHIGAAFLKWYIDIQLGSDWRD